MHLAPNAQITHLLLTVTGLLLIPVSNNFGTQFNQFSVPLITQALSAHQQFKTEVACLEKAS